MNAQAMIEHAAVLAHKSRNAARYAGLLVVDESLNDDAGITVMRYGKDWLLSSDNPGVSVKVSRNDVKPMIARMLDEMTSGVSRSWHIPAIPGNWSDAAMREIAKAVYDQPIPVSAKQPIQLLASVENLVTS